MGLNRPAAAPRFCLPIFTALSLAAVLAAPSAGRGGQDIPPRASGRLEVEFGLDSLERRFYRPSFALAGPLSAGGRTSAFFGLDYWQRINGDLEGTIDYWIDAGLVSRVSDVLSLEAGLSHFCRHRTSVFSPSVLNLNEVFGRVWTRAAGIRAGIGLGTYAGGSPGYDGLMLVNLEIPVFLLSELAFEGELKWVNFSDVLYEAGLSIRLGPGTDLFLKSARHYRLDRITYLGVRFRPEGPNARLLDAFALSAGVHPVYDAYKMTIDGAYRLALLRDEDRRFLVDVGFRTPILAGSEFFSSFWPDRMMYALSASYERRFDGLWAALYGRYAVDMPADKDVPFRASLAVGLALRNGTDFDRLDKPVRFEIRAGSDFKFGTDIGLKVGLNTTSPMGARAGGEFRYESNGARREAEALAFLDFGRDLSIRPFIGLRMIAVLAGESPSDGALKRHLAAGVAFRSWF